MRVSKQVMVENNSKIIEKAAQLFREKGIGSTSVVDVMKSAGLTHGGFYRHFNSKDELVTVAIQKAFNDLIKKLKNDIEQQGAKQAVTNFVSQYLTEQHVLNPRTGCPIATLGAEIDQKFKMHKKIITQGADQLITLFAQGIDSKSDESTSKAIGLLAVLVGSLVMARSAETKSVMDKILSSGNLLAMSCIGVKVK
jgi:TetR/AcrR family transcriptional repressor of nem operon